jgi:hypothetical protein
VATREVKVTIRKKNADGSEGEFVFSSVLGAREQKTIPWTTALFIEAEPPENLELDLNGQLRNFAALVGPGVNRGALDPPKP